MQPIIVCLPWQRYKDFLNHTKKLQDIVQNGMEASDGTGKIKCNKIFLFM